MKNNSTTKKICALFITSLLFLCAGCGNYGAAPASDATSAQPSPLPSASLQSSPPPVETAAPTATATTTTSPSVASSTPVPTPALPLSGITIGLDPGHQGKQNSEEEPVSPGSSQTKMKVTSGAWGTASGIPEHEVNLAVALLLKKFLEEAGATVIMTRETADVDISNAQRAQLFNEYEVNLGIRIHCNSIDDSSIRGAFMLVPSENPFLGECNAAADAVLLAYTKKTGLQSLGIQERGDQTGFNWCTRSIINIEMGHMSNPEEDLLLTDPSFQTLMAEGLFDGVLDYFQAN